MIKNFDGKPMKIKKIGAIYPVDVELKEEKGQDILCISAKVKFLDLTMYEYENITKKVETIEANGEKLNEENLRNFQYHKK